MSRPSSRNSLEPPRKSVELEDPGAAGLESSDGEEYFSDASEGRRRPSRPQTPASPIPRTRVEKVDDAPSHGQVPGTDAYNKRRQDAVPDEVEVVKGGSLSKRNSRQFLDLPYSPGGTAIPRTVVEKIDPSSPSHGDIPGTEAYQKRMADATPDVILKNPDPSKGSRYHDDFRHRRTPSGQLIPETVVTRVDDEPAYGEVEGTRAKEIRSQDAEPDVLEIKGDVAGSPTLDRSISGDSTPRRRRSTTEYSNETDDNSNDNDFGDDFDDFEEGAQPGADDDFGDFDDGFQEPDVEMPSVTPYVDPQPDISFPLVDADSFSSLSDLIAASQLHFDTMFPTTTSEQQSSLSIPEPISSESPVFPSDRSRSLWKQLITPPPLQPPNWTQSRIRRLFLISLGVPVDLDEILPPSKQKKLVLPDINLDSSGKSLSQESKDSIARLKQTTKNDSTASLASSTQSASRPTKHKRSGSKLPANPPPLDLPAVKRLCATTDEKLDGFADDELQGHVKELETMMEGTQEVLEYWLKRRDEIRKEKEAFEGVIENLVRHARRVRK